MAVPFPLTFEGCRFEAPLQVSGATLQEMALLRCELPGLLGNGVDVRQDLNLCRIIVRDATVTAADRSPGMNYADHGVRGSAIGASRLSVGGDLLFEGACRLDGRVDLPLATLGRLTVGPDCRFDAHGNTALDLTNAALASHLGFAPGVNMRGTLRLTGATVHGTLTLEGAPPQRSERPLLPRGPVDHHLRRRRAALAEDAASAWDPGQSACPPVGNVPSWAMS
jgi:hypothetical protein